MATRRAGRRPARSPRGAVASQRLKRVGRTGRLEAAGVAQPGLEQRADSRTSERPASQHQPRPRPSAPTPASRATAAAEQPVQLVVRTRRSAADAAEEVDPVETAPAGAPATTPAPRRAVAATGPRSAAWQAARRRPPGVPLRQTMPTEARLGRGGRPRVIHRLRHAGSAVDNLSAPGAARPDRPRGLASHMMRREVSTLRERVGVVEHPFKVGRCAQDGCRMRPA